MFVIASQSARRALTVPSPCAARFQAFSVNEFRLRIRDERPETRSDHVPRSASAARKNKAYGLGRVHCIGVSVKRGVGTGAGAVEGAGIGAYPFYFLKNAVLELGIRVSINPNP